MCRTNNPDAGSNVDRGNSCTPADESRKGFMSPIKLSFTDKPSSPRTPPNVSYKGNHPSILPALRLLSMTTPPPPPPLPTLPGPPFNPTTVILPPGPLDVEETIPPPELLPPPPLSSSLLNCSVAVICVSRGFKSTYTIPMDSS